eukprot:5227938-Pyramimonas_sp.AAC.1
MPLALQYGFHHVENFLRGAWGTDAHFRSAPLASNLPVILGLLSVWNVSFLGHAVRAILPYQQALAKLPAHIQQVGRVKVRGELHIRHTTPLDTSARVTNA